MKKALRETQTLRAGWSKAEPEIPPLNGGAGRPKFIQLEFGEDRCTQFRVIMVTDPQTNKQTHSQIHTRKPTDRTDYSTLRRSVINLR